MSGNDSRTAFLGRLEKIRELIASFFRAFTQDEVHHDCLRSNRTAPYRISQWTSGRQRLSDLPWALHTDRIFPPALDRENEDEGRRHGGVHNGNQAGTISMIGRENGTRTAFPPPKIDRDGKIVSLPPASAEFAVCSEWWKFGAPEEIRTPDIRSQTADFKLVARPLTQQRNKGLAFLRRMIYNDDIIYHR
jgi:hypothetical protein